MKHLSNKIRVSFSQNNEKLGKFVLRMTGPECTIKTVENSVDHQDILKFPFKKMIDIRRQEKHEKMVEKQITSNDLSHFECQQGLGIKSQEVRFSDGEDLYIDSDGWTEIEKSLKISEFDIHPEALEDKQLMVELYLLKEVLSDLREGEVYLHPQSGRAWLKLKGSFFYNSRPDKKRSWGGLTINSNHKGNDLLQISNGEFIKGVITERGRFESQDEKYYKAETGERM